MTELIQQRLRLGPADLRELAAIFVGEPLGCPGCAEVMDTARLRGETINVCFTCGAGWFDAGELAAFEELLRSPGTTKH